MKDDDGYEIKADGSALRSYTFVCFAALALLLVIQLQRGLGYWSLLFAGIGLAGVTLRWRIAPILLIVFLTFMMELNPSDFGQSSRALGRGWSFSPVDWLTAVALLAYVLAHYRIQSLTHAIFPHDKRREQNPAGKWPVTPVPSASTGTVARSPGLASSWEISRLIMSLPVWAILGQLSLRWLPQQRGNTIAFPAHAWSTIVLAWALGLGIMTAAGVLAYLGRTLMTQREARLFMQDTLWRETRREQSRVNHWLAWAWLRRRKEKS